MGYTLRLGKTGGPEKGLDGAMKKGIQASDTSPVMIGIGSSLAQRSGLVRLGKGLEYRDTQCRYRYFCCSFNYI